MFAYCAPWFLWLAGVLLRATVLLTLAALAALACRRASAAQRHLLWALALVGVLLLPVLSAVLPAWKVLPVYGRPPAQARVAVMQPVTPPAMPALTPAAAPQPVTTVIEPSEPVSSPAPIAPSTPSHHLPRLSWYGWVTLGWGMGALLLLARWGYGYLLTRRLLRRAQPAPAPWIALLAELAGPLPVRLLVSDEIAVPIACGFFHPVILLPAGAGEWPAERLRLVLLHELAHISRRDLPVQILAQLACALYWPHPLVWLAVYRLRVEREAACDDAVLGADVKASDYAAHLLAVASLLQGWRQAPVLGIAMARSSRVGRRIRGLLDGRVNRRALTRGVIAAALLFAAVTALLLATLRRGEGANPSRFLPGGGTITLLGVTCSPFAGRPWWTANGTPLPRPLFPSRYDYPGASVDPYDTFRTLVLRVDRHASALDSLHAEILESFSYPESVRESRQSPTSTLLFIDVQDTANDPFLLHLRLRDRPWETVAKLSRRSAGGGFRLQNVATHEGDAIVPTVTYTGLTRGGISVSVTNPVPGGRYDGRLVVIGRDGKEIKTEGYSKNSEGSGEYYFPCRLAAVKEMRVEVRPISEVKFPHVALHPRGMRLLRPAPNLSGVPAAGVDQWWGSGASLSNGSDAALSIAADHQGHVYLLDGARKTVTRLAADGRVLSKWLVTKGYFWEESTIAADGVGHVYVADGYTIRRFSPTGKLQAAWDASQPGDLPNVEVTATTGFVFFAFTVSAAGDVFVAGQRFVNGNAASSEALIRRFSSDGKLLKEWVFNAPEVWTDERSTYLREHSGDIAAFNLCVDPHGNLYVTATGGRYRRSGGGNGASGNDNDVLQVKKYSPDGELLARWGGLANGGNQCTGIAVDAAGVVYMVLGDGSGNAALRRFTPYQGYLTDIPLRGSPAIGVADGRPNNRLAFDGQHSLYLASSGAPSLRKVTLSQE